MTPDFKVLMEWSIRYDPEEQEGIRLHIGMLVGVHLQLGHCAFLIHRALYKRGAVTTVTAALEHSKHHTEKIPGKCFLLCHLILSPEKGEMVPQWKNCFP